MLEQMTAMFDDMAEMLNRIKKKVYGERMEYFRKKNEALLLKMTDFVERAEKQDEVQKRDQVEIRDEVQKRDQVDDRGKAAAEVAKTLADAVEARFAKRGKISGRCQMDINLFMIYYVFPAILLTQSECAVLLADAIRDEWRERFRDSEQLGYATYEEISATFKEKFLGIF